MSFFETLKNSAPDEWLAYTEHPFTEALGDGSLPEAAFKDYLVQDYLFLIEFARAYALAAYKAPTLGDMREAQSAMSAILDVEMDLHVSMSANWGLSAHDLETSEAAPETLAYTRYVLETGMRGDLLALKVALAPCVIGYGEIATRLATYPGALSERNPYANWISEYAGSAYQDVAGAAVASLDKLAERYLTPARERELAGIFREATRLEADFWEMGWRVGQGETT
jgi:thiaminase/transcriptional activator TenA